MQNQICIPQINSDKDALSSYIDWTYCLQNMQIINMLQKCSAGELVLSGMERKIWMQEKIKVDETRLVKASSVLKEFAMDVFFDNNISTAIKFVSLLSRRNFVSFSLKCI